MESCIFSYFLCETDRVIAGLERKFSFGKFLFLADSNTDYQWFGNSRCECALFGLAVDVCSDDGESVPQYIVDHCADIREVLQYEKRLGGKYILLYRQKEQYYLIEDATGSIPVFYHTDGEIACSGNPCYLVSQYGELPDSQLKKIRDSGDISQAMPFDITEYRSMKQLLPNHYLQLNNSKAIRFVNSESAQPELTIQQATELAAPMIQRLTHFYAEHYKLYCPITSGRDSRVVLAFLEKENKSQPCYTIYHSEFNDQTQDLVIPKQLCASEELPYEQIRDAVISEELIQKMDNLLGQNCYSRRTVQIACTIKEHFSDGAVVNGDIIGQVGKCSLHRDIPGLFATPSYFRCKIHNYSGEAKKQLNMWIREIRQSGEQVNLFDLFSVENRMGRWAAQENLVYNTLGQTYLNIFNSRSIIYIWTAVSRKERKQGKVQMNLIYMVQPSLLNVPFESDESALVRLSKRNGLTYLLASYAKYYYERFKFLRGRK